MVFNFFDMLISIENSNLLTSEIYYTQ